MEKARTTCPEFTVQTMLALFLDSRGKDGRASSNIKAKVGDNKPIRLFQTGYVSNIKLVRQDDRVYFTAQCQPEMRRASDYRNRFAVECRPSVVSASATVQKFLFSECTCPVGKAPHASCKHVAAVLYTLEEFSRMGYTWESTTCTERLQQWNQPRSKKAFIKTVSEMDWRKARLAKQCFSDKKQRPKLASADLNYPRASKKCTSVQGCVDGVVDKHLRRGNISCLVLACGSRKLKEANRAARLEKSDRKRAEWLKRHHDHSRQAEGGWDTLSSALDCSYSDSEPGTHNIEDKPQVAKCQAETNPAVTVTETVEMFYEQNVVVDKHTTAVIEQKTREQSESALWHASRRMRITPQV